MKTVDVVVLNDMLINKAFDVLGPASAVFDDNGGDPDGNVWAAYEGDIEQATVSALISAGLAYRARAWEVDTRKDDDVKNLLEFVTETPEDPDDDEDRSGYEICREALLAGEYKWCGYSISGTIYLFALPRYVSDVG